MLSPLESDILWLSLRIGLCAVLLALPFALFTAFLLARGRFYGRSLLAVAVYLPLVLPPVVTGYGLLLLFGRYGPLGRILEQFFGIIVAFRWTGAAIAAAVMAFPLMVRAIQLSFEAIDPGLDDAAASLGAPPIARFFTVTLPLAAPGILAGTLLGFAKSLGEFGATITFVSNIPGETRTLPIAIYSLLQVPGGETNVLRLAGLSILVSLGAILGSELIARHLQTQRKTHG